MKKFKQIDCWTQAIYTIAIVIFLGLVCVEDAPLNYLIQDDWFGDLKAIVYIFCAFTSLNILQLISLMIHHVKKWNQSNPRKTYQYIAYIFSILIVGCLLLPHTPLIINIYSIMFLLIPAMDIFYLCLCFYEYNQLKTTK